MANEHSVSQWLDGVKAGDTASIERLWQRYFERLVRLARGKLPVHCRRAFDEEDVAISAFQSFCERPPVDSSRSSAIAMISGGCS